MRAFLADVVWVVLWAVALTVFVYVVLALYVVPTGGSGA